MKTKLNHFFAIVCLIPLLSCAENTAKAHKDTVEKTNTKKQEAHSYGGWYCPDNLAGFPAVDISEWQNVPVVNGRMASPEECSNGTSLIQVDMDKYPDAKPLDMHMPKLARYKSHQTGKEEIIIIIQALNISNDSIVGFRYLNGGNGSSRLSEVTILTDDEIHAITPSRFVNLKVKINAPSDKVFEVITKSDYSNSFQPIFDKNKTLKTDWRDHSKINFKYLRDLTYTSAFADRLFGNNYIQIDYKSDNYNYVEKFFFNEEEDKKTIELQIVCGPYEHDYESQNAILTTWAQKVKQLSESDN